MPKYSVESIRQPMTATGIVEAMPEWEETPEGKRRPSDRQARNEDTGMPLWGVEVLYIQTTFRPTLDRDVEGHRRFAAGAEAGPSDGDWVREPECGGPHQPGRWAG